MMKLLKSRERLFDKIMSSPDMDADAGFDVSVLEDLGMFLPPEIYSDIDAQPDNVIRLKETFAILIRKLRKRDKLTIKQLAETISVEEEEIHKVEHDPHHTPRPGTVHNLANFFKIPVDELMKLSGAKVTYDTAFQEEAFRFAAKSDDMAALTKSEQDLLGGYVKFLSQHKTK